MLHLHLKKGSSSNSRNGFECNFHGAWFNTTVIDIIFLKSVPYIAVVMAVENEPFLDSILIDYLRSPFVI